MDLLNNRTMNYYIRGNKEKADQIKAAFEKLGYNTRGLDFSCGFFYTFERDVHYCVRHVCVANIIKTHPDYQELELPIQPKFKAGDRIVNKSDKSTIYRIIALHEEFRKYIVDIEHKVSYESCPWIAFEDQDDYELALKPASNFKKGDLLIHNSDPACRVLVVDVSEKYGYQLQGGSSRYHLSFTTVENEYHLWTIKDAKDGDVLVDTLSGTRELTILFISINEDDSISSYCGWNGYTFRVTIDGLGYGTLSSTRYVPATKEQRDLFFTKMREAGYQWDSEKKELRKIKPHYDISNFYAGMPVLVRDDRQKKWCYALYSHYDNEDSYQFVTAGDNPFIQCIPFEGNEHLLGTTDMCDECYINW